MLPSTAQVRLTGSIYRESDVFVSHCNELDIETYGHTLDETYARTKSMIELHFQSCRKLGTLDDILRRLGVTPAPALQIHTEFALQQDIQI